MVGWNYRLVGVPDPIVTANLRWLAGYRHPAMTCQTSARCAKNEVALSDRR
jgi:hypothetical protein